MHLAQLHRNDTLCAVQHLDTLAQSIARCALCFDVRHDLVQFALSCCIHCVNVEVSSTVRRSVRFRYSGGMDQTAPLATGDAAMSRESPNRKPASVFPVPTTLLESFRAWWRVSPRQTAEAELYLLSKSGYFQGATLGNASHLCDDGPDGIYEAYLSVQPNTRTDAPFSKPNKFAVVGAQVAADGKVGCSRLVDIGSEKRSYWKIFTLARTQRYLSMLEIGTPVPCDQRPADETKIVLVHGYGAGTAFFYRNLASLASEPNSRLYALDWLGMGRSSRPTYSLSHTSARSADRVKAAEGFFVSSLEQWREKMRIEKMVLVGHSLGGYLSTVYALRYPERVSDLVLVSPAGFPEGSLETGTTSVPADFESDIEQITCSGVDAENASRVPSPPRRFGPRTVRLINWLWDHNVSPFSILRMSTVFGPLLLGNYTRRRFGKVEGDEQMCLHAYCHGICTQRGSSEYCCMSDSLYSHSSIRHSRSWRLCTSSTGTTSFVTAYACVVFLRT